MATANEIITEIVSTLDDMAAQVDVMRSSYGEQDVRHAAVMYTLMESHAHKLLMALRNEY